MKRAIVALALLGSSAGAQMLTEGVPPPAPGKSQIVVFRDPDFKGSPISCAVHENGVKLTSLPGRHYAIIPLEPGKHELVVKSEHRSAISDEFKPDTTYYAECTIGAGILVERPHLNRSNREAFMAALPKLKPVDQ